MGGFSHLPPPLSDLMLFLYRGQRFEERKRIFRPIASRYGSNMMRISCLIERRRVGSLAPKQPEVAGCCPSFRVGVRVIPIHANTAAGQIPGVFYGDSVSRALFSANLWNYYIGVCHLVPDVLPSSASRSELLGRLCRSGGERLLSFPSCADGMLLRTIFT